MTSAEPKATPTTVAISGASGLVGQALSRSLLADGQRVVRLVRHPARPITENTGSTECQWSTTDGVIDAEKIEGVTAMVHLAGENLAGGRWTKARRKRIRDSRVLGTRNLVRSLTNLQTPPQVLVSASAVGYYGDRGDQQLDESARPGTGFLAEICVDWEAEAKAANEAGIRTVVTRLGVVLSPDGGALDKMLTPFKMGLGGRLGSGAQYFSWITLSDVVRSIRFAIEHQEVSGPVNVTAPTPVTNAAFTKALGKTLSRPTAIPVPASALRLALGDMADEALLASTRAIPKMLLHHGFDFEHSTVEPALRAVLSD